MKLQEINKPGSPEHKLLQACRNKAVEHHNTARDLVRQGGELFKQAGAEIMLGGQALNKAKALIDPSNWEFWVNGNCPLIGIKGATAMIRYATDPKRLLGSGEEVNLKQLQMVFSDEEEKPKPKEQFTPMPAYMTGLDRAGSFLKFIDRVPLDKWPDCGIEQLKEDFEPIAKRLWPERF